MHVLLSRNGEPATGRVLREIVSADEVAHTWPLGLAGEDDATWHWPALVAEHATEAWARFELQADGRAQGLMILKRQQELRAPGNTALSGCYIEYLAAAPWNRPPTGDKRFERVTPVGLVMLNVAICLSVALGQDGRLGWHSKPGAEEWYKKSLPGLWLGGPDISEDGLEYFELSSLAARAFVARHHDLFAED